MNKYSIIKTLCLSLFGGSSHVWNYHPDKIAAIKEVVHKREIFVLFGDNRIVHIGSLNSCLAKKDSFPITQEINDPCDHSSFVECYDLLEIWDVMDLIMFLESGTEFNTLQQLFVGSIVP